VLELDIVNLYEKEIMKSFSINEIARALNKAYPNIHAKVTDMISRDIFTKQVVGRSNLCTINLDNEEAKALLFLNKASNPKYKKARSSPELKTIIERIKKLSEEKRIISVLVHEEKNKGKEIIVIIDEKENEKEIKKNIRQELGILNLSLFSKKLFLQNCLNNSSLLLNNDLIFGYENFYSILAENFVVLKANYDRQNSLNKEEVSK